MAKQPADLVARLQRVARYLENDAAHTPDEADRAALLDRAYVCKVAAARLEELTRAGELSN